ncbi:MAG: hypothetical protein IJF31_05490 [Clostridia bacterium]|nr:hypothetical protein [Clostridia bacterium]
MKTLLLKYGEALYRAGLSLAVFLVAVFTGGETARLAPFAVALLLLLCVGLFTQKNVKLITLPFLQLTLLLIFCYDSFSVFIGYIWLAPIVVAALGFYLWRTKPRLTRGPSLWPLVAVSAATLFGGIGMISVGDYFRPASLMFMLGLGPGLVLSYLIMKHEYREKAVREGFARDLLWWGLTGAAVTVAFMLPRFAAAGAIFLTDTVQWSNNMATILMIAMPAALMQKKRHVGHYMLAGTMFAAGLMLGSRGGALFIGIELIVCCLFAWRQETDYVLRLWNRFYFAMVLLVAGYCFWFVLANAEALSLVRPDEARAQMLRRGFENFLENPLFGSGLGYRGNADLYSGKQGTINWYHVFVAQVVGGLGACGVLAWGYQLYVRFCLAWRVRRDRECGFALCYLGLFLMSMVNPGEFCPVPYAFLAVCFFALLERHLEDRNDTLQADFYTPWRGLLSKNNKKAESA